jgi:hypothetical protein
LVIIGWRMQRPPFEPALRNANGRHMLGYTKGFGREDDCAKAPSRRRVISLYDFQAFKHGDFGEVKQDGETC